ncbi:MAG: trypsin-like peptidase domain-containing protein [Anaerolineales bacterium]|nr:trypsin-like peptidase domain-containing protein [Anaerolineales bacterium]MCB0031651.1 trypsin-like peptidase domain-containing protein [Anaerolineales bacterium]
MSDEFAGLTMERTGRLRRLRQFTAIALRRGWPFAATIAITLLSLWSYAYFNPPTPPLTTIQVEEQIQAAIASVTPAPAFSADVYQQILPSLVIIQIEGEDEHGENGFGLGSGVIVSADATILTAYHVIAGADRIQVGYYDGTVVEAAVANADPANDIAVLQPFGYPEIIVPAILGNPYAMRVGDEAYAVGNPLGMAASMSAGVISGFNRSLPINENQSLDGLIQFDTAVNPGNSGGPLLNRHGQVVGIVTALVNPSDQDFFIGLGFAVPISVAGGAAGAPEY